LIEYIVEAWDMGGRKFRPVYLEGVCRDHPLSGLRILRQLAIEYRGLEWYRNQRRVKAYPDPRRRDVGGWYIFTPGFVRWLTKERNKKNS
jgi:hypothetical protein